MDRKELEEKLDEARRAADSAVNDAANAEAHVNEMTGEMTEAWDAQAAAEARVETIRQAAWRIAEDRWTDHTQMMTPEQVMEKLVGELKALEE